MTSWWRRSAFCFHPGSTWCCFATSRAAADHPHCNTGKASASYIAIVCTGPHAFWACLCKPVAASLQIHITRHAALEPEMVVQVQALRASRQAQLRHPLRKVAADLNQGRPWDTCLGRQKELRELFNWVVDNPGEQRLHIPTCSSSMLLFQADRHLLSRHPCSCCHGTAARACLLELVCSNSCTII